MHANVTKSARISGAKDDQLRDFQQCGVAEMRPSFEGTYSVHHSDEIIKNLNAT
jgi:hypothetical protein